ncbi:IS66 family insertion sequence element accessory protein TnpA [Desulfoprunum benzoelyticum]
MDEWKRSGLTRQDGCRNNGIALATFGSWRRKLKANESERPLPP